MRLAQRSQDRRARRARRLSYLHGQPEQGNGCPLTMTYACVPTLRHQPELAKAWMARVTSTEYDLAFSFRPGKKRQHRRHGHDREAGRFGRARQYDQGVSLGHRRTRAAVRNWSVTNGFSRRQCVMPFLVLAYVEQGISCFLLPRFTPDGKKNAIRIQRLKDKLGDWSNASSEVEFQAQWAG